MSISSCYDTIARYNTLKQNLLNAVGQLNVAQSRLNSVPGIISNAYSVNDANTPIVGRVNYLNKDIAGTASYIRSVIIPAIDRAISQKRREIFQLEQQQSGLR